MAAAVHAELPRSNPAAPLPAGKGLINRSKVQGSIYEQLVLDMHRHPRQGAAAATVDTNALQNNFSGIDAFVDGTPEQYKAHLSGPPAQMANAYAADVNAHDEDALKAAKALKKNKNRHLKSVRAAAAADGVDLDEAYDDGSDSDPDTLAAHIESNIRFPVPADLVAPVAAKLPKKKAGISRGESLVYTLPTTTADLNALVDSAHFQHTKDKKDKQDDDYVP